MLILLLRGCFMRCVKVVLVSGLVLLVSACGATKNLSKNSAFVPPAGPFKVAVMKPDVEVALLTAGGLMETNADWSETAKKNMLDALEKQISGQGGQVMVPSKLPQDALTSQQIVDLERLHRAVGSTIFKHSGASTMPLPTKKDKFDWSLGSDASTVGTAIGADYGLFLFARDSFSSGGRVAMQVLGSAGCIVGFCVIPSGGQQIAFVSLVEMKTGSVVWFNVLAKSSGDLRKVDGANLSVADLIKGMPVTPQLAKAK
jgi:hypothetical protein